MGNINKERISTLRSLMRAKAWDAVILTGSDPHSSEYPAQRYKQVQWLTGFTGEAGDVVITDSHAGLWTDTRYFIQANVQLEGTGAVLHKTRVPEQVLIPEWLRNELPEGSTVAVDGLCVSAGFVKDLSGSFNIVSVPDLLSAIWKDRPAIPQTPVFTVESGESRLERLEWLRETSAKDTPDSEGILLSTLDDIAWTLNVRASDIEYNPLVISYLLVPYDPAAPVRWFVLKDNVEDPDTEATFGLLTDEGIVLEHYADIESDVCEYSALTVDPGTLNWQLYSTMEGAGVCMFPKDNPVPERKAVKNGFELDGMTACHIRDGVAMEKFLYWLEKSVAAGKRISEWDAAVKLGKFRAGDDSYRGDSFETISAYGPGAALPHYITPHGDAPVLEARGLYLVDSGGQYTDGTTDITRTVPLGECSQLEREDYTLVLKGFIDLAMAVFPEGTAGCQIDALARGPLWQARRNFGHGTGHGVGFFLGVHEYPVGIRQNFDSHPILPGMVTSDEPGIYREGLHGVRHENLIRCVEDCTNEFGKWLRFESLTQCHFDTSAIEPELLGTAETAWLNAYNARVYDTLSPLLPPEVAEWLEGKCKAISPMRRG